MRKRVNLLDTWIDSVDLEGAVARIDGFVRARTPHQIVTVNVDFLRLSSQDYSFRDLINTSDLAVPDGMPLLWGARLQGEALPERVTGADLIVECARLAAVRGYSIFLLGAAPGVAEQAATALRARFPALRIAGTYAPPVGPFSADEQEKMVRLIQELQPDMLFVAFGAPRQDRWIRANMRRLGVPVCMGVGGSFDFLAGRVKRAPLWMQDYGLEWLYRVTQEPGRLWRRYADGLPVVAHLLVQRRAAVSYAAPPHATPLADPFARAQSSETHSVEPHNVELRDDQPHTTVTPKAAASRVHVA